MLCYCRLEGDPLLVDTGTAPLIQASSQVFETRGNFSSVGKTRVLNLLRGQNFTGFTPYAALFNGNPEEGGAELSGGNYARVPLAYAAPAEIAGTNTMSISNSYVSSVRADSLWGTCTHVGVMDSQTGGACVAWATLENARVMGQGCAMVFNEGRLPISIN